MSREQELDRLLGLVAEQIDRDHCRAVDARYRLALAGKPVDRTPLVVSAGYPGKLNLPRPWDQFQTYAYREAFHDPVAMLQNELLGSVAPGLLLKDDSPLMIRNNHGTIQMASLLGGRWEVPENDFPWIKRFDSQERIREIADSKAPIDLRGGILPPSFRTLEFYAEKLRKYPVCQEAIQIALPDLQGPLDTAEQLWGSDIYLAVSEESDLFNRLLARITDAMLTVAAEFRKHATDRLDPFAIAQHEYMVPGRLLVRNDSAIMLSPGTYRELVLPHDARLLHGVGGGSIHFCGNGRQLVTPMLEIPDLRGLDITQPELNNIREIYRQCREHRVAVTGLTTPREDLVSGKAAADYPTGCVLVYLTSDLDDAREVLRAYHSGK